MLIKFAVFVSQRTLVNFADTPMGRRLKVSAVFVRSVKGKRRAHLSAAAFRRRTELICGSIEARLDEPIELAESFPAQTYAVRRPRNSRFHAFFGNIWETSQKTVA
jgi:hypothetical protein